MTYSIQQTREGLEKAGYVANDEIATAQETMRNLQLKGRDVLWRTYRSIAEGANHWRLFAKRGKDLQGFVPTGEEMLLA